MFRLFAIINQSTSPPFYIIVITWLLDLSYSFYRVTWRSQCNYTKSTVFVNNWSVRMFPTCTLLPSWWLNSNCILTYIHDVSCILVFVTVNLRPKKIYNSFLGSIFNNNNYVNASEIARNMMYINVLQKVGVLNNSVNESFQFEPLRMQGKKTGNLFRQTNLVHAYSSLHMKRDMGPVPFFILNAPLVIR